MKKPIAFLLPLALTACASAGTTARPAAPPLPATPAPTPATVPEVWQNLDLALDGVPGTSTERALSELLANRRPARTVVVAVIDGGVDTAHVDLVDALWRNPDETAGNGRDDDGNGYVDDVYGWNFIGGPDGRNVDHETLEVTRLFRLCRRDETPPTSDCGTITRAFEEERTEAAGLAQQVAQIQAGLATITPMLREAAGTEELTDEVVRGIETSDPRLQQARDAWLQLSAADITAEYLEEVGEDVQAQLEYNLDPEFDPRGIVGDDLADGDERVYGNRDVMGPDAEHGTHVAGIIAAARNGMGNDGIAAPNVRIMAVRAVPNGDERDKDVANAIRYAVDEGAHIINMSFGKSFSPRKHLVDGAVRYAEEHGVLLVHAAGNDGQSLETADNFPNPYYEEGGRAARWITIGASGWKVDSLAAPFSNYGPTRVDLFAPGVEILSTAPGGEWERNDGTSMAAPVVTGVAALLMAYFPDLDADDVKEILLASAVRHSDRMVPEPGEPSPTGEPRPVVRFGTLSVTGGVVNAYEAVRLALERTGG